MLDRAKYWKSILAVGAIFMVANLFLLRQEFSCFDCIHTYGFPLPVFAVGGFGIRRFLWVGLVGDLLVLFGFAAVVSWIWRRVSGRNADMQHINKA
jgi:hypothetical protein